MHSEHLTNLHPGWIVGGWLVAVAVTSGVYLALMGIGLFPEGPGAVFGVAVGMAIGFFAGGLFVGWRWMEAPVLHGAAMTFVSVLVLFLGTSTLPQGFGAWSGSAPTVLGLVLLQLAAAVAGGWTGRRLTFGPEPGGVAGFGGTSRPPRSTKRGGAGPD